MGCLNQRLAQGEVEIVLASFWPPKDVSLLLVNDSGWGGDHREKPSLLHLSVQNGIIGIILSEQFTGKDEVNWLHVKVETAGLGILPSTNIYVNPPSFTWFRFRGDLKSGHSSELTWHLLTVG